MLTCDFATVCAYLNHGESLYHGLEEEAMNHISIKEDQEPQSPAFLTAEGGQGMIGKAW